ncbi:hypothetical protein L3X38_027104 [Prunus dulcis]|uniref:Uncharacterized protein n=1 Tax=Prunus dulcis TaxID=3755 RepID=A0AAD4VME4_PRUDU|nr:hypothetical protein L3X38_027104 [Prunus dulcis]
MHSARQAVPQARSQRVHEGRAPYSDRVRSDGIRWVLREADLHPHQQHHCWICLGHVLKHLVSPIVKIQPVLWAGRTGAVPSSALVCMIFMVGFATNVQDPIELGLF